MRSWLGRALLLALLLITLNCSGGGTGGTGGEILSISGRVRSLDNQGIPSLTVSLQGSNVKAKTASDGSFLISKRGTEREAVLEFDGEGVASTLEVEEIPEDTETVHLDLTISAKGTTIEPTEVTFVNRRTNQTTKGRARVRPRTPRLTPTPKPEEDSDSPPSAATPEPEEESPPEMEEPTPADPDGPPEEEELPPTREDDPSGEEE